MKVTRLDHVNITTGRLPETIAFYVEGIGLRRGALPGGLDANGGDQRGAWLYDSRDLPILHLLRDEAAATPGPSPIDHFALNCDDYDGFTARLKEKGISYRAEDYPNIKLRQLVVHDPNGLKIELNFEMGA